MAKSEVAQLRRQIELELEAMERYMTAFAVGTARHEFIRKRMERIGSCQERLAEQVGEMAAAQIVCNIYIETMEASPGNTSR
jgi:hypothetical protein